MSLSEWKDVAAILGTMVAVPGVLFAVYKAWQEVVRIGEQRQAEIDQRDRTGKQRERELELKRVEFTLAQHRRLFDDKSLCSVLQCLDGDQLSLRDPQIIESKRKFLTFFEEMILLRNSGYISSDIALYMFGYYAKCAHRGENFRFGIAYKPEYWNLFMSFAEEAEHYLASPKAKDSKLLRL